MRLLPVPFPVQIPSRDIFGRVAHLPLVASPRPCDRWVLWTGESELRAIFIPPLSVASAPFLLIDREKPREGGKRRRDCHLSVKRHTIIFGSCGSTNFIVPKNMDNEFHGYYSCHLLPEWAMFCLGNSSSTERGLICGRRKRRTPLRFHCQVRDRKRCCCTLPSMQ